MFFRYSHCLPYKVTQAERSIRTEFLLVTGLYKATFHRCAEDAKPGLMVRVADSVLGGARVRVHALKNILPPLFFLIPFRIWFFFFLEFDI